MIVAGSLVGQKLGKYEVVALLGSGGMATVYQGYQADVERYVAIKVLPPHPGLDSAFIDRFRLEARTIARLQHPHILPLYDYGTQDDILYLVMQYVDGGSLKEQIDEGRMDPQEVARLLVQISSALDYAHRQGVIHRDIKPANILLTGEGYALLADFGIAKLAGDSANLTGTGGLVGTPAYMPPEQGRGGTIDSRADIYSLGVVVYEMLTGSQPYVDDTAIKVVLKHVNDPVPRLSAMLSSATPALDNVLLRALAKSPVERYQTASAFSQAFSAALSGDADPFALPEAEEQGPPAIPGETKPLLLYEGLELPDMQTHAGSGSAAKQPTLATAEQHTVHMPGGTQVSGGANAGQTTIIRQTTSPLLLLGVAAIIVLLVIVVLVLANSGGSSGAVAAGSTPTSGAEVTETAVAAPTETPLPVALAEQTFGTLSYSSAAGVGDTVSLSVENFASPPTGQVYAVWLRNTGSGETLLLGELVIDGFGEGVLRYTDPEGRNLAVLYNAVLVSLESSATTDAPGTTIAYSGAVPLGVTQALSELLVESANGIDGGGLVEGALVEARNADNHAGLAARAGNIAGVHVHAEHTINIMNGTEEDYDGSGRGQNPGRGIGVYFFLDQMSSQLDIVGSTPDAPRPAVIAAEEVRICLDNVRQWSDELVTLELELAAATDMDAAAPLNTRATAVTALIISGQDANANTRVEPSEQECGLEQILVFALNIASIDLHEGGLE